MWRCAVNKNELVAAIARSAELTKADAENALNAVIQSVQTVVAQGQKVVLVGFGTFAPSFRKARTGTNPQTRAPLQIPASTTVKFTVGSDFKQQLNA